MIKSKKGASEVVGTVLLILLAIVVVSMVSAFVLNIVNGEISKSECHKLNGKVKIINNPKYTCYTKFTPDDLSTPLPANEYKAAELYIQIHLDDTKDLKIKTLRIKTGGADSRTFDIVNGTAGGTNNVEVYKSPTMMLLFPDFGTEKTYNITDVDGLNPESFMVWPILEKNNQDCAIAASTISSISECP
ncbi:MAG: type IV pilin [Candidatus Pacearchaeota archaeon]